MHHNPHTDTSQAGDAAQPQTGRRIQLITRWKRPHYPKEDKNYSPQLSLMPHCSQMPLLLPQRATSSPHDWLFPGQPPVISSCSFVTVTWMHLEEDGWCCLPSRAALLPGAPCSPPHTFIFPPLGLVCGQTLHGRCHPAPVQRPVMWGTVWVLPPHCCAGHGQSGDGPFLSRQLEGPCGWGWRPGEQPPVVSKDHGARRDLKGISHAEVPSGVRQD